MALITPDQKQLSSAVVPTLKLTQELFTPKVLGRFWPKVDKNGPVPAHRPDLGQCWIWTAATCHGYGKFRIGGRRDGRLFIATRVSWFLAKNQDPFGLHVLHHCDNPACINPGHLFQGTDADNARDKVLKGRQDKGFKNRVPPECRRRGVDHQCAKLDDNKVREIRRLCELGIPQRQIAKQFGVAYPQISYIKNRKTWKHVV